MPLGFSPDMRFPLRSSAGSWGNVTTPAEEKTPHPPPCGPPLLRGEGFLLIFYPKIAWHAVARYTESTRRLWHRRLLVLRNLQSIAGLQVPNLGCILLDGPVRGELTSAGHVENGHLIPSVHVPIGDIHPLLRLDIVPHIGQ